MQSKFDPLLSLYFFSFPPCLKSSSPSADTALTVVFPATINFTFAKMSDQSSKTVNGTCSLTQ